MNEFKGKIKGLERMLKAKREQAQGDKSAVVYTGAWHDSIPRRLILDVNLTPVEKLTWQIIRTHIGQPGEDGAWPSIGRIAKLACVSRPTIQNAIDVLEAYRWISVLRRVRDEHGNVIGNYYMLHDAPMPIAETMVLAPGYLSMLKRMASLSGPSKQRVRKVSSSILKDKHYTRPPVVQPEPQGRLGAIKDNLSVNDNGSENRLGMDLAGALLEEEHSASLTEFDWSDKFDKKYHKKAASMVYEVPNEVRASLVKNFNRQLDKGSIRNPISYLGGLIKCVKQGTFIDVVCDNTLENSYEKSLVQALTNAKAQMNSGSNVWVKGHEVEDIYGVNINFKKEIAENVYTINAISSKIQVDDVVVQTEPRF